MDDSMEVDVYEFKEFNNKKRSRSDDKLEKMNIKKLAINELMLPIIEVRGNRKRRRSSEEYRAEVGFIHDAKLLDYASRVPFYGTRPYLVYELIKAYDLMRNMRVYQSVPATKEELREFHSEDYIEFIQNINNTYTLEDDIELNCGLSYDNPPIDGIYDYIRFIGGSTLTAARALVNKEVDIAVNWYGGWHHAKRDEASGFCYVNDVTLGIQELKKKFNNILYVDLDVHHGDAVQYSFNITPKVFTLSLHHYGIGYFPNTGNVDDFGERSGIYSKVNVPLNEATGDKNYCKVFEKVWTLITKVFTPDAIVVQCGADGLNEDPVGKFNLTEESYGYCMTKILSCQKPTLVLGGGGYNATNTAKCWAYITSIILGCKIDTDIPEHDLFESYGPNYELNILPSLRKDENSDIYLNNILEQIESNLLKFKSCRSAIKEVIISK